MCDLERERRGEVREVVSMVAVSDALVQAEGKSWEVRPLGLLCGMEVNAVD
jgi:hypothetical protein